MMAEKTEQKAFDTTMNGCGQKTIAQREQRLDFVRCVACVLIVIFHFYVNEKQIYPHIYTSAFDMGEIGVSLFFILSGASLYISNSNNKFNYLNYLLKRAKGVYPKFWSAYILATLVYFVQDKEIINWVPTYRLWFSLFGMDGLFLYKWAMFYRVGEWFLGTIIFIYLLYPILQFLIDRIPKILIMIALPAWLVFVFFYNLQMPVMRNPIARIFEVLMGMYYVKYIIKGQLLKDKKLLKLIFFLICVFNFGIFLFVQMPYVYLRVYAVALGGVSLFYILSNLTFLMDILPLEKFVQIVSKNSFTIFLVHHVIEQEIAQYFSFRALSTVEYNWSFVLYIFLICLFVPLVNQMSKVFLALFEIQKK